jgi:hypothetical protein
VPILIFEKGEGIAKIPTCNWMSALIQYTNTMKLPEIQYGGVIF